MKIIFKTNLDAYQGFKFPVIDYIPRIGEKISLRNDLIEYFIQKKLPTRLEVVDVTHYEDNVEVELWHSKTDFTISI